MYLLIFTSYFAVNNSVKLEFQTVITELSIRAHHSENCEKITGGLANMGRSEVGFREGVSPFPIGVGPGEGAVPPPRKFFNFLAQNSAFWHLF